MNYCPVYDKIGGHTYHAVYPGPIGEVISPQIFGMEKNADILNFCSLCGRCSEVCPVKIPLAETIRKLRSNKVGEGKKKAKGSDLLEHSKIEAMGFAGFRTVATNGFMWRTGISIASKFSNFVVKKADSIPVVKLWTRHRTPPVLKGNLHADIQKIEGVIYE
ncbi:MAG: lactate utilization protein, partial [Campylobacter sp.]|nr:lactate utilization protein [Campylobacter sp.]